MNPPARGMPRPRPASPFSLTPRMSRKPTALLIIISAAGGRPPRANVVARPLTLDMPTFLSTSSDSAPTSTSRIALRIRGSSTSYPRSTATVPTIRVAWR